MIYLYAITEATADLAGATGLEDQAVRREVVGDLVGLFSVHEQAPLRPDPETLWRHDQVIESAMQHGPTLPVRFGTTLPDAQAFVSALESEAPRFRRQLETVRGCVELAVRVGLPQSKDATPSAGRGYVQLRLSEREARQAAAERTLVPLDELAISSRRTADGGESLKASYLVREQDVRRFADEVRVLQDRHRELSLSCTGPWPPYSFVGEEAA